MTETRNGAYPRTATTNRSAGNEFQREGVRRERGSSGEWGSGPSSESLDRDGSRTAAAVAASQPLVDKTSLAKIDHEGWMDCCTNPSMSFNLDLNFKSRYVTTTKGRIHVGTQKITKPVSGSVILFRKTRLKHFRDVGYKSRQKVLKGVKKSCDLLKINSHKLCSFHSSNIREYGNCDHRRETPKYATLVVKGKTAQNFAKGFTV